MAVSKPNIMYKKKFLDNIAETMFNNKHHSDVTLVVNKTHYYACKIVMSAASEVFASLIREHFNNCMDQEVMVPSVQYNESFLNILRYIHGVEINLTLTSKVVVCEMISLANEYKLNEFHEDLKVYISKLKRFKVNSAVALLNTSKTYELFHLYDKLQIYVYQHTEEVIKHKSFVNLKYDILLDLLKSDFLYCKEKDILSAALNWHDENIIDPVVASEKIIDSEAQIDENLHVDNNEVDSSFQNAMAEHFLRKFSIELFDDNDDEKVKKENNINNQNEQDNSKVNVDDTNIEIRCITETASTSINTKSVKTDKEDKVVDIKERSSKQTTQGVVEIFSGNVLSTLLKQIRFERISMFDFLDIKETDIFAKYEDSIVSMKNKIDIINKVKRKKYSGFNKTFTISGISKDNMEGKQYFSLQNFSSDNLTWKIYLKHEHQAEISDEKYFGLYLNCKPEQKNWEYTTTARITLISHDCLNVNNVSIKYSKPCYFSKFNDSWGWNKFIRPSYLFDPNNHFIQNDSITVEVIEFPSSTPVEGVPSKPS